jgi:hypothetical protein
MERMLLLFQLIILKDPLNRLLLVLKLFPLKIAIHDWGLWRLALVWSALRLSYLGSLLMLQILVMEAAALPEAMVLFL